MFFAAKKDMTYSILIWGTFVFVLLVTLLSVIADKVHGIADFLLLVITSLVTGLLVIGWFRIAYEIESKTLRIQGLLSSKRINIDEIKRINKEKSILASAALSVDRLSIQYGKYEEIHVAPKNEEKFIQLLINENPDIQLNHKLEQIIKSEMREDNKV